MYTSRVIRRVSLRARSENNVENAGLCRSSTVYLLVGKYGNMLTSQGMRQGNVERRVSRCQGWLILYGKASLLVDHSSGLFFSLLAKIVLALWMFVFLVTVTIGTGTIRTRHRCDCCMGGARSSLSIEIMHRSTHSHTTITTYILVHIMYNVCTIQYHTPREPEQKTLTHSISD